MIRKWKITPTTILYIGHVDRDRLNWATEKSPKTIQVVNWISCYTWVMNDLWNDQMYAALQSQKAVSAYFMSKQILPFGLQSNMPMTKSLIRRKRGTRQDHSPGESVRTTDDLDHEELIFIMHNCKSHLVQKVKLRFWRIFKTGQLVHYYIFCMFSKSPPS